MVLLGDSMNLFIFCHLLFFVTGPSAPEKSTLVKAADIAVLPDRLFLSEEELQVLWQHHRQVLLLQSTAASQPLEIAKQDLSRFANLLKQAGWHEATSYSLALLQEALEQIQQGNHRNYALSPWLKETVFWAQKLSPQTPVVDWQSARLWWLAGDYAQAVTFLFKGIGSVVHHPIVSKTLLGYVVWGVIFVSVWSFWLFVLSMWVKYASIFGHGFWHYMLPEKYFKLKSHVSECLLLFFMLLPLAFRLGPLASSACWLVSLSPYLKRQERLCIFVFLFLSLGYGSATQYASRLLASGLQAESHRYQALRDISASSHAYWLTQQEKLSSSDTWVLGLRAARLGKVQEAELYLLGQPLKEDAYEVWMQLAHLYSDLQQGPKAYTAYDKAYAAADKNSHKEHLALWYINRLLQQHVKLPAASYRPLIQEAQKELNALSAQAQQQGYLFLEAVGAYRLVKSSSLEVVSDLMSQSLAARLYLQLYSYLPRWFVCFFVLCVALLVLVLDAQVLQFLRQHIRYVPVLWHEVAHCQRCYDVSCSVCHTQWQKSARLCSTCYLMEHHSGLPKTVRVSQQIIGYYQQTHKLWLLKILSACFYGMANFLSGQIFIGFRKTCLWLLAFFSLLCGSHLLPTVLIIHEVPLAVLKWSGLCSLLIMVVISAWQSYYLKEPEV